MHQRIAHTIIIDILTILCIGSDSCLYVWFLGRSAGRANNFSTFRSVCHSAHHFSIQSIWKRRWYINYVHLLLFVCDMGAHVECDPKPAHGNYSVINWWYGRVFFPCQYCMGKGVRARVLTKDNSNAFNKTSHKVFESVSLPLCVDTRTAAIIDFNLTQKYVSSICLFGFCFCFGFIFVLFRYLCFIFMYTVQSMHWLPPPVPVCGLIIFQLQPMQFFICVIYRNSSSGEVIKVDFVYSPVPGVCVYTLFVFFFYHPFMWIASMNFNLQ